MKKIIFFTVLFLLAISLDVYGIYNDVGNDSCLTIYGDKENYAVGSLDNTIRAELIFDNRCGKEIKDLKLGLFLENRILGEASFESIHSFEPKTETVKNKSFVCDYTLATASITNQTTCVQTIIDANLSRADKTLWSGVAESIAGKTIFWAEKEVKPAKWDDKTKVLKPSTEIQKIDEKPDFDLKTGWQDITLPIGESRLKVLFDVPIGYEGKKEFIIKAYSDKDNAIVSVLDPGWYDVACAYRKKITLKTSDYLAVDVTNDHAIYVKQVAADTDFWLHETTGDHVRFTAADGSTLLKYYFQRFDDTNDLMDAWVKVTDTFTSAANTDIYMYYGCDGFSDGQDVANTLTNYLAAYHSDEGAGTAVSEKKGAYNATATSASIWDTSTQKIGAAGLNPNGSYYATNDTLLDTTPTNLSFSFWLNETTTTPKLIMNKNNTGSWGDYIEIDSMALGNIKFATGYNGNENAILTTTIMSTGTWYHVILTWNTTNGKVAYFNGTQEAQAATETTLMSNGTNNDFYIGAYFGGYIFDGKLDEVKVMNVGIDGNEAMLLYRSENGDLQTYGAEEPYVPPNAAPYMASIDLNTTYAKQNNDIKVTAGGVGDAESDNVTLLCGTAANPTIDTNNFCTDFGNISPYSDVSCIGKGASGDANKIVYCRLWDTMSYSIAQNIDSYIADNTAPATTFSRSLLTVTFSCSDAGSGCSLIRYNLDSQGWLDANSFTAAYGSHTFDYYSIDGVGNSETPKTGAFTLTGREIDPENISNQNFFDVGKYMSYKAFIALGTVVFLLFMLIFALLAFRAMFFR